MKAHLASSLGIEATAPLSSCVLASIEPCRWCFGGSRLGKLPAIARIPCWIAGFGPEMTRLSARKSTSDAACELL